MNAKVAKSAKKPGDIWSLRPSRSLRSTSIRSARRGVMRQATVGLAVAAASLGAVLASAQNSSPPSARIRGFSVASSAAELAREREFQTMPNATLAEADFDVMTAEPHHTGSPYEIKLADYVAERFKAFGFDVSRDEYSVLLPWPGERRIDIIGSEPVKLQVEEEKIRGDQWANMPRYQGDPRRHDRPSRPVVARLPMDQIKTCSPIPVQPMSYRDGVEVLKRLKGPVAPEAWRGALPITYHVGPGPAKVHMQLQMDYAQRRLINVVGRINGREAPDEWIIVGSHRDAWTFGASDSVSGNVSMISVARAFGDMMNAGWRPRRSLLFVSWDGEEQGLLGSTEWV